MWSTGSIADSLNGLAAGNYVVTITDVNGCVKIDSTTIQQTNPLVLQDSISNASCPGFNNGAILYTITGGTPPYQYQWSTSDSLNALGSGIYMTTVTDVNNCSVVKSFSVSNIGGNIKPSLTVQHHDSLICKYDSLGIGATPGFTTYSWNSGERDLNIYAHQGGLYYLQATDSFGCIVNSDTVKLISDSIPGTPLSYTTFGLAATLNSGQPDLSAYHWNFGNGYSVSNTDPSLIYIYPDSGTYTVTLITNYYCGADTQKTIVHVPEIVNGVNNLTSAFNLRLAPNPFYEQTIASVNNVGVAYHAGIYNVDGKMVFDMGEHTENVLTIERNNLAAGEYFLKIFCGEDNTVLRLVIE